tara:strand:- start:210 stop:452 length:243 start_codon:yes stop_codon:yes gene_type:complete
MKNLEVKIFVAATLLLHLLDETDGNTKFKHKMRHHINGTITGLESLLEVSMDNNDVSLMITKSLISLEESINKELTEVIE